MSYNPAAGTVANYQETIFTGGPQTISSGSYVDVTGASLTIVTSSPRFVRFDGRLTANMVQANPGPVTGASVAIAINIDGTDYPLGSPQQAGLEINNGNSQNANQIASGWKTLNLPAGSHTVKLRAKALSGSSTILSGADSPSVVSAAW